MQERAFFPVCVWNSLYVDMYFVFMCMYEYFAQACASIYFEQTDKLLKRKREGSEEGRRGKKLS